MKIITPKNYIPLNQPQFADKPVFFIAGPIRGGGDWQSMMCRLLQHEVDDCIIVVPNRWDNGHELQSYFLRGTGTPFPRQLNYERHYIELACSTAARGCLVFYLREQREPRPTEDGPYAQDTYGELGRWSMFKKFKPSTRLVVGAEENFPGLSQIRRNLSADMGYEFPIYTSMQETAHAAVVEALPKA